MKNSYNVLKDCVLNHRLYQCGTVYTDPHKNGDKTYLKVLVDNGFIKLIKDNPFKKWERDGVRSYTTGLIVAPEDYYEGDKKHFTFEEALEIEKKLKNGWRLPTRSELVLLMEEFGQDKDGKLNRDKLMQNLKLKYTGYVLNGSLLNGTGLGYWWSSMAYDATLAYGLYINSSGVNPGTYGNYRYDGFAVRLVKEI